MALLRRFSPTGNALPKGSDLNNLVDRLNGLGPTPGVINLAAAGSTIRGAQFVANLLVPVTLVNGAASGSFTLPAGSVVSQTYLETPVTIPGTPTNINLRLGSAVSGQQYVADVDVKTQGWISPTLLYPYRNPTTIFYTITPTGGTAASQVGVINIRVGFIAP